MNIKPRVREAIEVKQIALLRYLFWQGLNGGQPVDDSLDIELHEIKVQEQLRTMRQRSLLS